MEILEFEVRRATIFDYSSLYEFYEKVYPTNHPLKNIDFWKWQYGNPDYGTAYIVIKNNRVHGHVGAYYSDGLAWIINVYLDDEIRGKGYLSQMYNLARDDYQYLGATSANSAGLGLYRNMGWIRYSNLERFLLINPAFMNDDITQIISPTQKFTLLSPSGNHYWEQPGINGHQLEDGTIGNMQFEIGGFRIIDIKDTKKAIEGLWSLGVKWCDFVTSWNDKKITLLQKDGWLSNNEMKFPWYLNPIDINKQFNVSFLTENPLKNDFVCRRYNSDHGRVGTLPNKKD
jgi:hypothetical protein